MRLYTIPMTKSSNIAGIEEATGMAWEQWLKYFEGIGAKDSSHKEIAQKAYDKMSSGQESRGWWSQSVSVAYEQHIGRRKPGQRSDGTYEVTVSKTIDGNMDEAMNYWTNLMSGKKEFAGVSLVDEASTSSTPKWRHWRVNLSDDTKLTVSATDKGEKKSILSVTNAKLKSSSDAERWRQYWREILN